MTGWLIYNEAGAKRNRWFIEEFIKTAAAHQIQLDLQILSGEQKLPEEALPDFAVVRTIQPSVNAWLEQHGIPAFNNYTTSDVANNKWKTYRLCRRLGIPTMKTSLLPAEGLAFPFVIKSLDGHGGTEVFLIEKEQQYQEIIAGEDPGRFIAQEFCSDPGKDMRVYVLGETVVAAMLRTSQSDFRSNFSLGGRAAVCEVLPEQREIIKKIYGALSFDLVGIDFIFHNGQWVLNEIEDVVGTRMLYQCTDINIVELYIQYIQDKLQEPHRTQ